MTAHARVSGEIALLSARDYDLMIGAGVLSGRQVELRDGMLVEMNAEYAPHGIMKSELGFHLRRELDRLNRIEVRVVIDVSLRTSDQSVPEPDIVVVRKDGTTGLFSHESALLVVEVASSTRSDDLGWKASEYAGAGIAEYWVIDMLAQVVHRHSEPIGREYGNIDIVRFTESLSSLAIDGLVVEMSALAA